MNIILNNNGVIADKTARDVAEQAWSHCYHDAKRLHKVSMRAGLLAVFGSVAVAGAAIMTTRNPIQSLAIVTAFNAGVTFYCTRALFELDGKLSFLKDSFNHCASYFSDRDAKLSRGYLDTLYDARPTFKDYATGFKQYPFTSVVALGFAAVTALTREPAVGTMGLALLGSLVVAEEECRLRRLSDSAHKTKKMIELCNKLGLD